MSVVWMAQSLWADTTAEDIENATVSLFRQRPAAVQKLTQWVERWGRRWSDKVPEAFERNCKQPHDIAQLGVTVSSFGINGHTESHPRFHSL